MKLDILLNEDCLKDSYLKKLLNNYFLVSANHPDKADFKLNHSHFFEKIEDPYYRKRPTLVQRKVTNEVVDFIKENHEQIKLTLIAVILYKKKILNASMDINLIFLRKTHFNQSGLSEVYTPLYNQFIKKSINQLYLESEL